MKMFHDSAAKRRFHEIYEMLTPHSKHLFASAIRDLFWHKQTSDAELSTFKVTERDVRDLAINYKR